MLRTAVVVVYATSAMLLYSDVFWRYHNLLVGYADDVAPRDSRHTACGRFTNKFSSMQNYGRRVHIVLPYSLVCSRCSIVPIVVIFSCNPYACMRLFVGHTRDGTWPRTTHVRIRMYVRGLHRLISQPELAACVRSSWHTKQTSPFYLRHCLR